MAERQVSGGPWDFELDNIARQIEDCQRGNLVAALQNFFAVPLESYRRENPATVKFHLVEMVTCALNSARKRNVAAQEIGKAREEAYTLLASTDDLVVLEEKLTKLLLGLITMIEASTLQACSHNVRMAVNAVQTRYGDSSLYIQSLAKSMGVNPTYLGRQFKKETGVYFGDYLTRIRIGAAVRLLYETPYKASEIAGMVGFSDPHYFYSAFKRETGLSPRALRSQTHPVGRANDKSENPPKV